jgi:hypothetical protein
MSKLEKLSLNEQRLVEAQSFVTLIFISLFVQDINAKVRRMSMR